MKTWNIIIYMKRYVRKLLTYSIIHTSQILLKWDKLNEIISLFIKNAFKLHTFSDFLKMDLVEINKIHGEIERYEEK